MSMKEDACPKEGEKEISVPKEFGSGSTCHARFQGWIGIGVFKKVWKRLLEIYDESKGIGWDWQSMDSVTVKAPLGGKRPEQTQRIEVS